MEKRNYRVSFHDGPTGHKHKNVDVLAENSDEAFHLAYKSLTASEKDLYTDATINVIPEGPSVIGLKIEYYDIAIGRHFSDYILIRAYSESEAIAYYNEHFLGGRFWFDVSETEPDGKCVRGRVLETYYAGGLGYAADATFKA